MLRHLARAQGCGEVIACFAEEGFVFPKDVLFGAADFILRPAVADEALTDVHAEVAHFSFIVFRLDDTDFECVDGCDAQEGFADGPGIGGLNRDDGFADACLSGEDEATAAAEVAIFEDGARVFFFWNWVVECIE